MAVFSKMFSDIEQHNSNISFTYEDIRFNITNSVIEMESIAFDAEKYFSALEKFGAVVASVESFDGNLDDAVREFVDHNKELSAVLGIALEENQTQANGQAVEEKKNIFQKAWAVIVKFFKSIWGAICKVFSWIFNGFQSVKPKIEAAQKNWGSKTPEEKENFLKTVNTNVPFKLIESRFAYVEHIEKYFSSIGSLNIENLMRLYYSDPEKLYPMEIANALMMAGIFIADKSGERLEAAIRTHSTDFVNKVFTKQVDGRPHGDLKPFVENGWTVQNVDTFLALSFKAQSIASSFESVVQQMEKNADMSKEQMQALYEKLLQDSNSFLGRWFNKDGHQDIENDGPMVFQKGISTVLSVLRAVSSGIKDLWDKETPLFTAFTKSEEQIKRDQNN